MALNDGFGSRRLAAVAADGNPPVLIGVQGGVLVMQNQSHDRSLRSSRDDASPAALSRKPYPRPSEAAVCPRLSENADSRLFRKIAAENIERFTVQQNRVLDLLLAGHSNKHIAAELDISLRSVGYLRAAIAQRLGTHSFVEIVHTAVCGRCAISEPDVGDIVLPIVDAPALELTSEDIVRFDMREVSHRLKNFAAVIQSICHQTARSTTSVIAFDKIFSARLAAFCCSLDALVAGDWSNLSMQQLVEIQLAPFGLLDGEQITAAGPELKLKPAAAHAIGMALHELATNAVKYGSLLVPEGHATLSWRMETIAGKEEVVLSWQESNGPAVVEPSHKSFGLQVLQKITALALHGTVQHQFRAEGVVWQLRFDSRFLTTRSNQTEETRHERRC